MPRVELTNHAKYRLMEREIDVHQAKKVAKNGSVVKQDSDGTIVVKGTTDQGKILKVVYKIENNKLIIITAYYAN